MRSHSKVAFALNIVAATLALAAATVQFVKEGTANVGLIGAVIVLLAFAFAMKRRAK